VTAAASDWRALGEDRELAGHRIFTVEFPPTAEEEHEPLLVLHGFPSSSFDFHQVVGHLARNRRVLLLDMLGYGFSDKPDIDYTLGLQADVVAAYLEAVGVSELALLTHDMGDTVGGELLARQLEGRWPAHVTRRVLTNGSIYIEMAHLTAGQEMLLSLPDALLPDAVPIDRAAMAASLGATCSPQSPVDPAELSAMAEMVFQHDGHRVLPRLIRYIEERRANQSRFTGAIEAHPAPLTVVWGADDPIAVAPMADRLAGAAPGAELIWLDGIGHYPMVEAPGRFSAAALAGLG
jgi:pimeloyl-ACP methyl ester carboxylesterase